MKEKRNKNHETLPRADRAKAAWICVGLVVAVLLAYGQVAEHEFLDYDDGPYVKRNTHVASGFTWEGVRWSFSSFHMGNWHPLTWLSHMLDCELFGLDPGSHHLVSVALHAASAVLLFLAFRRMTRSIWPAAFVAAMFALHPLRVESVAWAAERKDVLSGLFWMLTLLAYSAYVERPGAQRYAWVCGSLALGLMAKPMLVTLPFVLLLLDVWPLARCQLPGGPLVPGALPLRRLVLEKLPLLVLVAVSGAIAVAAQRSAGAVGSLEVLSMGIRVQNALESYVVYLWKTLWPAKLAFYYPHPALSGSAGAAPDPGSAVAAGLLLVAVTVLVSGARNRRPYLAVGWLWYLGTLLPVIGLVQVGMQARADRYTYLPTIGVYLAVAWTASSWAARSVKRRQLVSTCASVLVVASLVATWTYVPRWRDSRTLAESALGTTTGNFRAHNLLGIALERESLHREAEVAYRQATEIKPDCSDCQINLGTNLANQGRLEDAAVRFAVALRIHPGQAGPRAHNGLGFVFEKQGDLVQAAAHFSESLRLEPDYAEAHNNLGAIREKQGRLDEARAEFERAQALWPDYAVAARNLGGILQRQGRLDEAAVQFRRAIRLDPELLEARFKLGAVYAQQGKLAEAAEQFEQVLQQEPALAEAHYNLGTVRAGQGDRVRAAAHFEEALRLQPDYVHARQALDSIRRGSRGR
jgi:Tfp pilus assembly protein PilF